MLILIFLINNMNILKKITITSLVLLSSFPLAVSAEWWAKGSNSQLYTNGGNGLGQSIINVAGCNGCSTGAGGGTIGQTVSGGTPNSVLFVDSAGKLGNDFTNFSWTDANTQLEIGAKTGFTGSSQIPLTVGGTVNNFFGSYVQNKSTGDTASSDVQVGANNDGTAFVGHYGDFGVQGSGVVPVSTGVIKNVTVANGGTGGTYVVGNVITITGGDGNATLTVATVTAGRITSVTITTNGTGYAISNNNAVTGGGGTGALINITALFDTTGLKANDIYLYGSGGDLDIGTDAGIAGKVINLFTGGTGLGNIRMTIADASTTLTTTDNTPLRNLISRQISSDTSSSRLNLTKARGTTVAPTTVVTGDLIGNLAYWAYDGSNYINSSSIISGVSGTVAATRVPTYVSFSTATDATPSVLTERMRIDNAGLIGIGTTVPTHTLTLASTSTGISANNQIDQITNYERVLTSWSSNVYTFASQAGGAGVVRNFNFTGGNVGINSTTPTGLLTLAGNKSASAWGTAGINLQTVAATYTDTSTASGTVANNMVNTFGIPTLATTGSAVTYTTGATVYIAGAPVVGTGVSAITNAYSLYVASGDTNLQGNLIANGNFTGSGSIATASTTSSSNFRTASTTGGTGSISTTNAATIFGGASTVFFRANFNGSTATALTTGVSYGNVIVGTVPTATFTSGTHAWLANMVVNPIGTITSNGATVTNTATLYVGAASAGVGSSSNYAAYVNGPVASNATQTTVSCSTSGNVVFSEPFDGPSYKQVVAYENACLGTASYTFPRAFTNTPDAIGVAGVKHTAISTTATTITGTTTTGFSQLYGY